MNSKCLILVSVLIICLLISQSSAQYYGYGYPSYTGLYGGYGGYGGYGEYAGYGGYNGLYGSYGYYGKRSAGFGSSSQQQQDKLWKI